MDGRILNTKISILIFAVASAVLYPKHTEKFRFLNPTQLSLKISKNSPALSILEDEKIMSETFFEDLLDREALESGKVANLDLFFPPKQEPEYIKEETILEQRSIRMLGGLTLKKSSPNITILKKNLGSKIERQNIFLSPKKEDAVLAEQAQDMGSPEGAALQEKFSLDDFMNLAPHLRNRLGEVENLDQVLNEDYAQASLRDELSKSFEEALALQEKSEKKNTITTTWTPSNNNEKEAERLARNFSKNNIPKNKEKEKAAEEKTATEEKEQQGFADTESKPSDHIASRQNKDLGLLEKNINQAYIRGQIELSPGLALAENSEIRISRKIAGSVVSEGQFILSDGTYEIYVDNPQTGTLLAELWIENKKVAQGELLLPELLKNSKNREDLSKAHITLSSVYDDISVDVTSAYSSENKKVSIEKPSSTINNVIYMAKSSDTKFKKQLMNSSVVVRSQGEGHWGTITVGSSRQKFNNRMFSEKTINALEGITGSKQIKSEEGIIWGQVNIMGNAVSGAEVEVISDEQNKPVYYSSFIPDTSLGATTENGQFTFMNMKSGTYIVRAKYKGKNLPPQVVFVEPGHVSQALFDVEKPALAEAFIFDIQTSEMIDAKLNFVGIDEYYQIRGGRKLISFSSNKGLQFLDVTPSSDRYYSTRVTVDRSQKEILVPMIPRAWLDELFLRLKTNYTPDSSMIVGLSQNAPYMVEMDAEGYNEDTKILYFNAAGSWVQGATFTPPGGGFVIANVNKGLRSLYVKYQNEEKLKVVTIAAETGVINIFNNP